jgi:hypothetical protein
VQRAPDLAVSSVLWIIHDFLQIAHGRHSRSNGQLIRVAEKKLDRCVEDLPVRRKHGGQGVMIYMMNMIPTGIRGYTHDGRGSRADRGFGNADRTSCGDSCWGDAVALAVAVGAALGVAGAEVGADTAIGELGRTAAELDKAADSAGGESDRTCAAPSAARSTGLSR